MADWNDPNSWNEGYEVRGFNPWKEDVLLPTGSGYGKTLTYLDGREFALQLPCNNDAGLSFWKQKLQKLSATGTFTPSADTLVIGSAFGWLVETIVDLGGTVWGTDISVVINDLLDDPTRGIRDDIRPLLLNVNVLDADAADQFKILGVGNNKGQFKNIVTENLLEDWPLVTMNDILDACDALLARGVSYVFHLVRCQDALRPGQTDPAFHQNLFTLVEFVALRPAHYWIDIQTGNVGGGV